jgi:hypothetical protein
MSSVKDFIPLRPGARPEDAPLVGWESYDPSAAIEVLRSFLEQDAEEHRRAFEFLKEALNEGRPAGQEMFPGT